MVGANLHPWYATSNLKHYKLLKFPNLTIQFRKRCINVYLKTNWTEKKWSYCAAALICFHKSMTFRPNSRLGCFFPLTLCVNTCVTALLLLPDKECHKSQVWRLHTSWNNFLTLLPGSTHLRRNVAEHLNVMMMIMMSKYENIILLWITVQRLFSSVL